MFEVQTMTTDDKVTLYASVLEQARVLAAGESNRVANAANISALLFHALPDVIWAGFYFFDGSELVVGPFQGKPACLRIPLGRGVCGVAAESRETVVVADVNDFTDHIVCDVDSRSEIAIPILDGNDELIGVLDLDSASTNRFDADDVKGLEAVARLLGDG
ncbi:MAG: GAF domain-containing protein [Gammaproteobacteria bacterium]|nr:MAG: GAF domain-containing protein [Gammaproteobacteria bacterium]